MTATIFEFLESTHNRPTLFEYESTAQLWDNDYTSQRMLEFHLNANVDISSRRSAFISRSVQWMASHFAIDDHTHVADFGCGPGLYTTALAQRGANVTGIDFSRRSIAYARQIANTQQLAITYHLKNYLEFETDERFDLITLIMCDFCALSPQNRHHLLQSFHKFLKPNGALLFDVFSTVAFDKKKEGVVFQKNILDGFWSSMPYYGFLHTFKYEEEKVILDKYTIVEPKTTRVVYNWLAHFTPETIEQECNHAGFRIDKLIADVAGTPFDANSTEFAIIARPR